VLRTSTGGLFTPQVGLSASTTGITTSWTRILIPSLKYGRSAQHPDNSRIMAIKKSSMKKIYVLKNVARHRYLKEHPEDILLLPKMKAADGSYVYFDTITGDSYDAEGKR
jgi:hypothetical protein